MLLNGLLDRIRQEFRDHPGLVLTETQAARRWSVDDATCRAAFEALIAEGTMASIADMYLCTETPPPRFVPRPDMATRAEDTAPGWIRPAASSGPSGRSV